MYINKGKLQDILSSGMITDYISYFDTADSFYTECSVIEQVNFVLDAL